MQVIEKVKQYIADQQLLTAKERIVVGVSGGADSIALLHILNALEYDCIAAHCNFHLREEESDRDESFVAEYCKRNSIKYVSTSFDTYKYMSDNAVSLEMAARELRYAWFEKICKEHNSTKIAVAHHLDDSIETMLINLTRGTGIRGLTGIPLRNGNIIRPLLCLFRNEIVDYLAVNNITYVDDSTNSKDIYTRNYMRLNVIPLLENINPSAKQTISNNMKHLLGVERIYLSYIENVKKELLRENKINISQLRNTLDPQTVLFELLYPLGFKPDTIDNIYTSMDGISGKVFYSDKYTLIKDRNDLLIQETAKQVAESFVIDEKETSIEKPFRLTISTIKNSHELEIVKDKNILFVDKEKISFPLHIRRWKQGDRFHPFGMKGSKKLSDYFTDNKYSLFDKENSWILCTADERIVWIVGERSSESFKVGSETQQILRIEVQTD